MHIMHIHVNVHLYARVCFQRQTANRSMHTSLELLYKLVVQKGE